MNFKVILFTIIVIIVISTNSIIYNNHVEIKKNVSIAITGDVMFARKMPTVLYNNKSPFKGVDNITSNVDLLLINFENAATTTNNQIKKDVALKCSPRYVPLARASNETVAALANNHILDYGIEGMDDTIKNLENNNITVIGAGLNESEAHKCVVKNISGRKITILNYMDSNNFKEYSYDTMPYANNTKPGYSAYDLNDAQRQIRQNNDSDLIIVYMHFGEEYSKTPNSNQIKIAHDLIDNGASVVIGCHPHVTQSIEVYKGKPIFYSLGNFIFDQSNINTHESYFIKINLVNSTGECNVYPINIYNYLPEFMDGNTSDNFLNSLSDELNISNGVGKLQFNLTRRCNY